MSRSKKKTRPIDLTLHFVDPAGVPVTPEFARVTIGSREHPDVVREVRGESTLDFGALPRVLCVANVEAPGFTHRAQLVQLTAPSYSPRGVARFDERVVLWPPGWLPVIVRTPAGEPYTRLANGDVFFEQAFDALARPAGAASADPSTTGRFVPWDHARPAAMPATVGALELRVEPPLDVTLVFFGRALATRRVLPGATDVAFELTPHDVARVHASLRLRVIDADTHAPFAGADVTFTRRPGESPWPGPRSETAFEDGVVVLDELAPGAWQLELRSQGVFQRSPGEKRSWSIEVRGPGALRQWPIVLAPGETLDLGDVELRAESALHVDVVDERGQRTSAFVEIGPYEPGALADESFVPVVTRRTSARGEALVPLPDVRSIVRFRRDADMERLVTREGDGRMELGVDDDFGPELRSANVLLDPRLRPPADWQVVLHRTARVVCAFEHADARAVEFVDELDLVVARRALEVAAPTPSVTVALVPGRYRARLLDATGHVVVETTVAIGAGSARVDVDLR